MLSLFSRKKTRKNYFVGLNGIILFSFWNQLKLKRFSANRTFFYSTMPWRTMKFKRCKSLLIHWYAVYFDLSFPLSFKRMYHFLFNNLWKKWHLVPDYFLLRFGQFTCCNFIFNTLTICIIDTYLHQSKSFSCSNIYIYCVSFLVRKGNSPQSQNWKIRICRLSNK